MATAVRPQSRPRLPLRTRPRPRAAGVRHLGPNFYAAVMGTSILGAAGAGLPLRPPGLRTACTALWALALLALAVLLGARAVHWARHRDQARAHLLDPVVAPFYGCLSMALTSVSGGTLLLGRDRLGEGPAVALSAALWAAGTAAGLVVAVGVPYLMVVRHRVEAPSPLWLLPVVAPMVSAATGPPLAPYLPEGQARATLLAGCHGMFGVSLLATLLILPPVFSRLVTAGPPPDASAPALLLVLGPLGQSVTAAAALADAMPGVPYARGLAVAYGLPVAGFALLWLALAGALVVRARRRGMRFAMTWWAFTFPVGTCVTGTAALARHTGLAALGGVSVALYVLLAAGWLAAASGTVRGLVSGSLLAGPAPVPGARGPGTARTR
ncbi:TDT family transporter [Streptomyces somaliensis DSM 40738]|uniref:TDT family transporter n=1 Tax=Streptomyces somaliensis (strain ATCC 33201 / DSM 40738 / JCM 12659 / KCTC 9044 / NCTC 11332 / NRRL B-12077 / IP 733) TaxID=1134445 RepID=A0AA44DH44_STRE0|nr:TDT family transporter [Streptomyces somaliensis]MCQ0022052.1 TDT family transporter [Streptomyces somaliensis DSM 40738]NKY16424.1 TDT family transporter [Streptomyces somaliensis DSM 40738]